MGIPPLAPPPSGSAAEEMSILCRRYGRFWRLLDDRIGRIACARRRMMASTVITECLDGLGAAAEGCVAGRSLKVELRHYVQRIVVGA
jgi:hypothetical protein